MPTWLHVLQDAPFVDGLLRGLGQWIGGAIGPTVMGVFAVLFGRESFHAADLFKQKNRAEAERNAKAEVIREIRAQDDGESAQLREALIEFHRKMHKTVKENSRPKLNGDPKKKERPSLLEPLRTDLNALANMPTKGAAVTAAFHVYVGKVRQLLDALTGPGNKNDVIYGLFSEATEAFLVLVPLLGEPLPESDQVRWRAQDIKTGKLLELIALLFGGPRSSGFSLSHGFIRISR